MEEAGLIDYWWRRYSAADPTPCLSENLMKKEKKKNKSEPFKRLTLKGLSGAFVILVAGYILSCLAFIMECSIARMRKEYHANKIIPIEDVKSKQKDVEAPTSKTGDCKVTAEVSLDEKQQENKDLKHTPTSDPILKVEKSKVNITMAAVHTPQKEISNQNIMKITDLVISDVSEEDLSDQKKEQVIQPGTKNQQDFDPIKADGIKKDFLNQNLTVVIGEDSLLINNTSSVSNQKISHSKLDTSKHNQDSVPNTNGNK